ncbi:hypothetical protein [Streptomyces sp. NPDC018947]|uniref:hypothetical protein n=1 Tax=Streptomyces sp. NPDC018947 TaxID=3365054 RepID=UPI00379D9F2E
MDTVVLGAWLLTAALGAHLATVWIRHGGLRQREPGVTRLPLWLVIGHVSLAVAGLAAWSVYLLGGIRSTAWAACGAVLVVAALGFMMLLRWLPSSGRHSQHTGTAERHFPLAGVVAHGMSAGATVLLVVLVVVFRRA